MIDGEGRQQSVEAGAATLDYGKVRRSLVMLSVIAMT